MTLHSVGHDAPSRWIQLRGPQNCRDLGGYLTSDGGIIPWRLALRSDSFAHATEADGADLVEHLGLRTVIDIRTDEERRAGALRPEVVGDAAVLDMPLVHWWRDGDGDASFRRLLDTAGRPAVDVVEVIASSPKPFVIHGESGAWRAGFVAAVLLGILGVGDGDISRDHALSTAALPGRSCARVAMQWLLDEMRRRHGSVVGYALDHGLPGEAVHDLRAVLVAWAVAERSGRGRPLLGRGGLRPVVAVVVHRVDPPVEPVARPAARAPGAPRAGVAQVARLVPRLRALGRRVGGRHGWSLSVANR